MEVNKLRVSAVLLLNGHRVNVRNFMDAGKILDQTRELACDSSVDIELNLTKKPHSSLFLDDNVQPFLPFCAGSDLHVGNACYNDDKIEKGILLRGLAEVSVLDLYK